MRAALALARRGLGNTAPNPSVGCVLVGEGRVIGRGTTAPGGRPHAERVALAIAGEAARGSTAYVTLEPCAHVGQTPPCADALIEAGVGRVVVGCVDPYPQVAGAGIARLRGAGIEVEVGVLEAEARAVHAGFLHRLATGRPLVTLKLATTLDGKIATRTGESQWITGPAARRAAHALRAQHDAVMVGAGTVASDDPDLTCRINGMRRSPDIRIVADTQLRTIPSAQLIGSARQSPTWLLHGPGADAGRAAILRETGATLIEVPTGVGGIDLAEALAALGRAGLTLLLVEGGAQIAGELLRAGLVDRLAWFHAPGVIGGDGLSAAAAFGLSNLADMPRFARTGQRTLGSDLLTTYARAPVPSPAGGRGNREDPILSR